MRLGKFIKTPNERKRYTVDYSNWLETVETLATVDFTIDPVGTLEIDAFEIMPGNKKVMFYVSGGDAAVTYHVTILVSTSSGQTKEDVIYYIVKDL